MLLDRASQAPLGDRADFDDLRPGFSAAGSPIGLSASLPSPLTSFVGRRWELTEIRQLLSACRLLTLYGPPGTGKTPSRNRGGQGRRRRSSRMVFASSPWRRSSTSSWSSRPSPSAGDPRAPALDHCGTLFGTLREQHCLLVLDNFEQVLPAGPMVVDLLTACPGLRVLVTSRAVLHLSGELTYLVPPLSLPDSHGPTLAASLVTSEAAQLLVDRARLTRA